METQRLNYIHHNQKKLRADNYQNFQDQMLANDNDANVIGQRVILPATYTGGPRYMFEKQADAMARVRKFGKPALLLTMTTNPEWDEITEHLGTNQTSKDRPDLNARVFCLKYKLLIKMVVQKNIFGQTVAYELSVEYQKRGLAHIHVVIWLKDPIRPDQIDNFVSAEIPDPDVDRELHDLVVKNMIHGPCGSYNPWCRCMENGKCTKHFPKDFIQNTEQGLNSYPKYRRRSPTDGGFTGEIRKRYGGGHTVDNRWVVPYNPWLLRQFKCHINLEICSSIKAVKYILKYINKGSDQAVYNLENTNKRNEITEYLEGRYVGSIEAFMRIMHEPIHDCYPPVIKLCVHLHNGQRVYFNNETAPNLVTNPPETTLTAFMKLCQVDPFARTIIYPDVPEYFTFSNKQWKRRKQGVPVPNFPAVYKGNVIGRVYNIHPRVGECYYLRLLLFEVSGPTSFDSFKQYEAITYNTYREACIARGLLEDDQHLRSALQTAVEEN
jgi:hypothetical protein